MHLRPLHLLTLTICCHATFAQGLSISPNGGAPDPSAMLDVNITSLSAIGKQGMLFPRTTRAQRDAIPAPADGLMIYETDVAPGFWYYDAEASAWVPWGAPPWRTTGNAGTDPMKHFLGTIDAEPFIMRSNGACGIRITTLGQWVPENTGGSVLLGFEAGYGYGAVHGSARNVYLGPSSGWGNGIGTSTGSLNTAVGPSAAVYIASGTENTQAGNRAGRTNQFGHRNTMVGASADILEVYDWNAHTEACAVGTGAWISDRTCAIGANARAGKATSGPAVYQGALALGAGARADTTHSTAIGAGSMMFAANSVRIGNTHSTSIGGFAPWTNLSDARFKSDIAPLEQGMVLVRRLRPITYRLDRAALDRANGTTSAFPAAFRGPIRSTGLSAQDLEAALIATQAPTGSIEHPSGPQQHYAVDYAGLVPHLVLAIQEQDALNSRLAQHITRLRARIDNLEQTTR